MSKLEELINRLCPDGDMENAEVRTLSEVAEFFNGDRGKNYPKSSEMVEEGIPFVNAGDVNGIVDTVNCKKITREKYNSLGGAKLQKNDILYCLRGSTGKNGIYSEDEGTVASSLVAIRVDETKANYKYVYYLLNSKMEKAQRYKSDTGAAQPNLSAQSVKNYVFPFPSKQEQCRIVSILDRFTFLTAELAAELEGELEARQKQYEYYRDLLLTFNDVHVGGTNSNVRWMKLGDVCRHTCSGSTPKKSINDYYKNGNIPWIRTQDVTFNEILSVSSFITEKAVEETAVKWIPKNCVIVAISGASAGRCAINKIRATTNQHCLNMEIDDSIAMYKYVFYCLCNQYNELLEKKQGARGDLNSSLVLEIFIPVPPLSEQRRIVSILDRFDALCNDLTSGLPAEIALRQKQYEYYRDKLLTFKELKKEA